MTLYCFVIADTITKILLQKRDWYSKVWFCHYILGGIFPGFIYTMWLIFISSGNKVHSGHAETGILKGGDQEHQVTERSSPARLNLPLTQGEHQDSSYTCVLFQVESSRVFTVAWNLTQRILEFDSTCISSKFECLRSKSCFLLVKINMLRWNLKSYFHQRWAFQLQVRISLIGPRVHSSS